MMQSAELQSKLAIWRAKALDGSITLDEMKQAIILMREGRKGAAAANVASHRSTAKAKAAIPSADDLLDELGA